MGEAEQAQDKQPPQDAQTPAGGARANTLAKRHGRWRPWLAWALSSMVVFVASCISVTQLGMAVLSRAQAKTGSPPWHTVKLVLAKPDGQLQIVDWEPAAQRNSALQRASPLLPRESGSVEEGDTQLSYEAKPDGPHAQIVMVTVRDPEQPSIFRYRVAVDAAQALVERAAPATALAASAAEGACADKAPAAGSPAAGSPCVTEADLLPPKGMRIEPLYSRISHQGYLFSSLPVGVALALALRWSAKAWLRRIDRQAGSPAVSA